MAAVPTPPPLRLPRDIKVLSYGTEHDDAEREAMADFYAIPASGSPGQPGDHDPRLPMPGASLATLGCLAATFRAALAEGARRHACPVGGLSLILPDGRALWARRDVAAALAIANPEIMEF